MARLPDDVFYVVCTQLWHQRDFDTLFNCACAGRQLADIAVKFIYRMHDLGPVPFQEKRSNTIRDRRFGPWVNRWRTIFLSSLGKTLYPYSRYIRTLDLGDLVSLLELDSDSFFQSELRQFQAVEIGWHYDPVQTANRIGEAITRQTPQLEELIGNVLHESLSRWIPRLPRLKYLEPFVSPAIFGNGTLVRLHCPSFKGLVINDFDDCLKSDQGLGAFLNELRPQSLESFKASIYYLGTQTFQALNSHGDSLIVLELRELLPRNIRNMPLLRDCTNLVSLSLADIADTDHETSHSDAFLETVAWLKECKELKSLTLNPYLSASALMTQIFSENSVHLTSLDFKGFLPQHSRQSHIELLHALANQTSLQRLRLRVSLHEDVLDVGVMVESLSKLVNLTDLRLEASFAHFDDEDIVQLASSLSKLEVLSIGGIRLTDDSWGEFASLRSLRRLELDALASSTVDGILGFIEKLGPGNVGLRISLTNVDYDNDLMYELWDQKELIGDTIAEKVYGWFEIEFEKEFEDEISEDGSDDEDEPEDEDEDEDEDESQDEDESD